MLHVGLDIGMPAKVTKECAVQGKVAEAQELFRQAIEARQTMSAGRGPADAEPGSWEDEESGECIQCLFHLMCFKAGPHQPQTCCSAWCTCCHCRRAGWELLSLQPSRSLPSSGVPTCCGAQAGRTSTWKIWCWSPALRLPPGPHAPTIGRQALARLPLVPAMGLSCAAGAGPPHRPQRTAR